VARGGDGGNASNQFVGQQGDALSITLDLKLISDIGFVGFVVNDGCACLFSIVVLVSYHICTYTQIKSVHWP